MAARAKKKIFGKAICSRHQRESALSRFGARVRYWIWLRGSASYVINIIGTTELFSTKYKMAFTM